MHVVSHYRHILSGEFNNGGILIMRCLGFLAGGGRGGGRNESVIGRLPADTFPARHELIIISPQWALFLGRYRFQAMCVALPRPWAPHRRLYGSVAIFKFLPRPPMWMCSLSH